MLLIRLLWKLTGDDYRIIEDCNLGTKVRFALIGILVICIYLICFLSLSFAFVKIFNNTLVAVLLGVFFAWMIYYIYLLMLYTLSKVSYSVNDKTIGRMVSVGIRLTFIVFISIIVAKPMEQLFFIEKVDIQVAELKEQRKQDYRQSTLDYFKRQIDLIQANIDKKEIKNISMDKIDVEILEEQKSQLIAEQSSMIASMERLVDESDYFFQSILLLNKNYPICWGITLINALIFLLPFILKMWMKSDSPYCIARNVNENRIILEDYSLFKERYAALMQALHQKDFCYSETYEDPPYNTIRKQDRRVILSEEDLLETLYNEEV